MSAAVIGTLKENPIDCSGKLKVMAKQVRPWLTQPSGSMRLIHKSVRVIRRQPAHPIRAGDSKSRTKAEYMAAILNLRTKTKRALDKPGRPHMDPRDLAILGRGVRLAAPRGEAQPLLPVHNQARRTEHSLHPRALSQ